MKTVLNYLNDCKEKTGSDYMTAKKLGIAKESVCSIRKRGKMSDDTAVKMADLLGVDRKEVLIAAAIARSQGDVRDTWENISKMSGIAASVVIACVLSAFDAEAAGADSVQNIEHAIHYAKSLKWPLSPDFVDKAVNGTQQRQA